MRLHEISSLQQKHGGEHLGTLLWWSLSNNHIQPEPLHSLARHHGLEERYLPSPVRPTSAFRRAWRSLATRADERLMLRRIAEDDQELVIGVVRERADEEKRELDYDTMLRIWFNKQAGTITADNPSSLVGTPQDLYLHHHAHTTQDIRAMLTSFVRSSGIALREMGGVYFVPTQQQSTLQALAAVVEAAGDNTVYRLPIYDAPRVKDTLATVARASLDQEIRLLQEELASFDQNTRQGTLERRLGSYEELRSRVALFAGVLCFKADDLKNKLAQAQAELRARLGLSSEEHEAEPATVRREDEQNIPETLRSPTWGVEDAIGF